MKHKLKDNVDYFEIKDESKVTRCNRMMYAYFRIKNVCQFQILLNMNSTNFYDILHIVENIIHFVNEIYKNSNERNTIQKKIHQLRQRNRFFVWYFIQFQRYIENIDYDAQVQLAYFNEKLFYKIKNVLIIQSNMFLKQLISHCQRINNKLYSFNNTLFDKWVSISIFSEKFKISTFFISTVSFTLNFTINFVNNVSNNDYYHDSMNFFVIIIDFRYFWLTLKKLTIESIDERIIYAYIAMKMIIYLKIVYTSSRINCVLSILPLFYRQSFLFRSRKFLIWKTFNSRTTSRSKIEKKKVNIVCFISYALCSRNQAKFNKLCIIV